MLQINPKLKSLFSKILNSYVEKKDFNSYMRENNIYSEEETIIGYLTENNKKVPVYRKMIIMNNIKNSDVTSTEININNLKEIINFGGAFTRSDSMFPICFIDAATSFLSARVDDKSTLIIKVAWNAYIEKVRIVLEYTKTTD